MDKIVKWVSFKEFLNTYQRAQVCTIQEVKVSFFPFEKHTKKGGIFFEQQNKKNHKAKIDYKNSMTTLFLNKKIKNKVGFLTFRVTGSLVKEEKRCCEKVSALLFFLFCGLLHI